MRKILSSTISKNLYLLSQKSFSSAQQYDVAVIGGGPGGYVAAIKAGQLGLKTVCIEKRGTLGGTCLNVGCIPSKALLNISHKYEEAGKHFAGLGINVQGLSYDWGKMQKKKDVIVKSLTMGIEGLFKKNKVDYVKGYGTLADKNSIKVKLNDGKDQVVNAKNIILATGSEPSAFPGIPYDEKTIISSTGALSLQTVPKKLLVIGAGVIGLELGSVYKRLGSQVEVVEFLDRIVPGVDLEIANLFHKNLTKNGFKIHVSHKVVSGKKTSNGVEIQVEPVKGGKQFTLSGDVLLIATGRRSFTDNLGAKELGLKMTKQGQIEINDHFQTNIPNIYAIGDIVRGPMLAHKAEEEGIATVEFIAGKGGHVNYNAIPGVVYTFPEIASCGKTEEELKEKGIKYAKGVFPFLANSRAKCNDETEGMVKILTNKATDEILGIHIMGPNAGEMIAEGVLGMEYGASSEDIGRTCHAHPTLSEAFKEACLAAHFKPIHF